jgi:hypothetical protein
LLLFPDSDFFDVGYASQVVNAAGSSSTYPLILVWG